MSPQRRLLILSVVMLVEFGVTVVGGHIVGGAILVCGTVGLVLTLNLLSLRDAFVAEVTRYGRIGSGHPSVVSRVCQVAGFMLLAGAMVAGLSGPH